MLLKKRKSDKSRDRKIKYRDKQERCNELFHTKSYAKRTLNQKKLSGGAQGMMHCSIYLSIVVLPHANSDAAVNLMSSLGQLLLHV